MKRRITELSKKERIETLDVLYTAASAVKGRAAVKLFLRDLLTESERVMLGRRILIARMLLGGAPHSEICMKLKVGGDTVGKVAKWLSDTAPGYETAIQGLHEEHARRNKKLRWKNLYADDTFSGTLARLKKKYPLHFLLFPMPKRYKDV